MLSGKERGEGFLRSFASLRMTLQECDTLLHIATCVLVSFFYNNI